MKIKIPPSVLFTLTKLEENGHEAYLVGGCVRDVLLGKEPQDWDITTSALPQQIKAIFRNTPVIETGITHGTVTVIQDHMPMEITTYRIDGAYIKHRKPEKVAFGVSLNEDLARRDFTVNAMAYHPLKGLIDPFDGSIDLQNKMLRCVGVAQQRFEEDALRILRALRFSAVLGFSIEQKTAQALLTQKELLRQIAAERVQQELIRLLCGAYCAPVLRQYYPILSVWVPEILPMVRFDQHTPYHAFDVWEHTIRTVEAVTPSPILRLTMLLHDSGKPATFSMDDSGTGHFHGHGAVSTELAQQVLKRLKCSNVLQKEVCTLVKYHDIRYECTPIWIKHQLRKFGSTRFLQLLEVHRADISGQNPTLLHRLETLAYCKQLTEELLAQPHCITVHDLTINGNDLQKIGIPSGKTMGTLLQKLLDAVINEQCENNREALLQYAKKVQI